MLGVGTTRLYDKTVVYNHKRHGSYTLGGRTFDFRVRPSFPRTLNREFLLVDLVNNLDRLADYGNVWTKKFFAQILSASRAPVG